jgi:hypothetical protein
MPPLICTEHAFGRCIEQPARCKEIHLEQGTQFRVGGSVRCPIEATPSIGKHCPRRSKCFGCGIEQYFGVTFVSHIEWHTNA